MSTFVFLRGLTRESRHWGDFPALFHSEIPDAGIVALDLPGNGSLNSMRSPTRIAAMTDHCRTELAARGVRPPYYLLAMSLGAMVAVAWVESHPENVRGCVLINTSLRRYSPFYQRLRLRSYPSLFRLMLPGCSVQAREHAVLRLTSNLVINRAEMVQSWSTWRRERPVSRANALRQLWAASRYRPPLQKPPVPMLVLASAGDALVDPRCSRQIACLWQAEFAEHPAAGHDIPLDDGAWVARQVGEWLQRI